MATCNVDELDIVETLAIEISRGSSLWRMSSRSIGGTDASAVNKQTNKQTNKQ